MEEISDSDDLKWQPSVILEMIWILFVWDSSNLKNFKIREKEQDVLIANTYI